MHAVKFSKVVVFSLLTFCQLPLFHCNFNSKSISKLNLTTSKFSTQNCTFHHIVGENDTKFWPSFISQSTGNMIEKFNHDLSQTGRYNQSQLLYRSSHGPIQKRIWGNCEVKIIHLDWTRKKYLIADSLLEEIILRNENPAYILFITGFRNDANAATWTPEKFNFIFGAFVYTLTSKFLFLNENLDLYLLCNHCHTFGQLESKLNVETHTNLEEIDNKWLKLHTSLDLGTMDILPTSMPRFTNLIICSPYKSRLSLARVEDCVVVELQKRFNFSLPGTSSNGSTEKVTVGGMFYGSVSGAAFNREVFLLPSVYKYSWINYASAYYPYIVVTLVGSMSSANFLTLVEPLDLYCWIGLIITYISVTILIFANSKLDESWETRSIVAANSIRTIRNAGLWGICVLLEQSSHHLLRRFRWTWIAASCWLFLSFVVSNGYKGDLFSSMAAQRHPTVPSSIHDLVTHFYNLPMMTTTKHYTSGKYAHSTLKDIVLPDMAEDLSSRNSLHEMLLDKLVFLNGSDAALIINISMELKVTTDLGYPLTLSDDFALVSSEADVKVFTILARRFTKYSSIQNSNQVSPYITRVPWFGYRNFFIDIFTRSLSSLLETGIYEKWNGYRSALNRVQALQSVDDKIHEGVAMKSNITQSRPKTNYYAMAMLASKRTKNNASFLKGVSLQNVKIPIIFCSLCALLGWLAFICEVVFHLAQIGVCNPERFLKSTKTYFTKKQDHNLVQLY